jgi:hypothetical protein
MIPNSFRQKEDNRYTQSGQNGDERSIAKRLQNGKIKRVFGENAEGFAENQKSRGGQDSGNY